MVMFPHYNSRLTQIQIYDKILNVTYLYPRVTDRGGLRAKNLTDDGRSKGENLLST